MLERGLQRICDKIETNELWTTRGQVHKICGMSVEVVGLNLPIGSFCHLISGNKKRYLSKILGFSENISHLLLFDDAQDIKHGDFVIPATGQAFEINDQWLGRVVNGLGLPLDGKNVLSFGACYQAEPKKMNPLHRKKIENPLDVGVRVLNGLFTLAEGQRIGLFAGSGVGKSVLLGMMTQFTTADIVVIALIGERGREIKEFIDECLQGAALEKSVVIAAPADEMPLMRENAAMLAMSVAEHFRHQGKKVLLICDSLTRYAHALREIGLSINELPSARGFPPSMFSKMSHLMERGGCGSLQEGSITAIYTVLSEGEDMNDPIVDHARSILDGHIILTHALADSGIYPAVDIERSISRTMPMVVSKSHYVAMQNFKKFYSLYTKNQDLIRSGIYQSGSDTSLDAAIFLYPKMLEYIEQNRDQVCDFQNSYHALIALFEGADQ